MRNFRPPVFSKSALSSSVLTAIAVGCLVPAAGTQVQSRSNHATTANSILQNTGGPGPAIPSDGPEGPIRAQGAATVPQTTKSPATSPTRTSPIFLAPANYSTGDANAIAVADVNGDGKPDLVVANCPGGSCSIQEPATISVLLGNGDGTFQDPVTYPSGGMLPTSIQIADMNLDGKPDIVVTNESFGVSMLLGNGDGTFQPVVGVAGIAGPQQVLVADVNHDGKPDLVVLSGSTEVLLGNGDGTFQPIVIYEECIGCLTSSLAIADVNGDGKLDLLVSYWDAIGVRLGNGDGTFQSETFIAVDAQAGWLAAGDVNRDGHIDLVYVHLCLGPCPGTLSVMLGNGDGTFSAPVAYGWDAYRATSVVIADINEDGKADLVIGGASCPEQCSFLLGGIGVLLGNGDGTFEATFPYAPFSPVGSNVVVKDVNGDNLPDVISTYNAISAYSQVWLHVGSAPTTTTLTSTLNPSVFGQPVTRTATVLASTGTPTGTVELFDNASGCLDSNDCGGTPLANGSAIFSNVPLTAGSHVLVASYQGSLAFNSSKSTQLNQVVKKATTATSVVSSLNPATPRRKVTYTATVTGQYGGPAGGNVTFSEKGATLATVPVANGEAAFSTSNQSCGVHPITASYPGDPDNYASSQTLSEQVLCSTTTSLATSGSPTYVGQPVTFTATVTSYYGTIPNGETVTFYDGATALASAALVGGTARFATSTLSAKSHFFKASYAGDGGFTASSAKVTQNVIKYSTSTTLSSSLNPSQHGQPVTFTANVQSVGGPVPTGKVVFLNGLNSLGAVVLSGGVATLTKSTLPAGTDAIRAEYFGDADSALSTSATLNQVVQ